MAIEIVSFPINSMVIFHSYVSLPKGSSFMMNILQLLMVVVMKIMGNHLYNIV